MGMFDTVRCEYPLPCAAHQDLEFQTKDLECLLEHYTITKAGRLLRQLGPFGEPDGEPLEWPYHGTLNIYTGDPERERGLVEYVVYFSFGVVDAVIPVEEGSLLGHGREVSRELAASLQLTLRGRALTADELYEHAPEQLELVEGRIPGGERLMLLLVTQFGWDRTMMLLRSLARQSRGMEPAELDSEERQEGSLAAEQTLLSNLRARAPQLEALLASNNDHWGFEDPLYRFYHQSFKVYGLQEQTLRIVAELQELVPGCELDAWFREIIASGTGKRFRPEHNTDWTGNTRPIVEAFLHARFFLEMAVRYSHLEEPPNPLPSGYGALLAL